MNNLRNSVQLIGHLGKDTEKIDLPGGKMMAKVTIATNDYYTNKDGERVENTQWHQVVAFGKTAENMVNLLKKGSEVAFHGKLNNRNYEDKEGIKRYITEVVASEFVLFGKKENNNN